MRNNTAAHMQAHSREHAHTQTRTHTYAHACTHSRTHAHTHAHAHARTRTHAFTHTLTHSRTHARARMHACTHARTHTAVRAHIGRLRRMNGAHEWGRISTATSATSCNIGQRVATQCQILQSTIFRAWQVPRRAARAVRVSPPLLHSAVAYYAADSQPIRNSAANSEQPIHRRFARSICPML